VTYPIESRKNGAAATLRERDVRVPLNLDAAGRRMLEIAIRAARLRGAVLWRRTGGGRLWRWKRAGSDAEIEERCRLRAVTQARARALRSGEPTVVQAPRGRLDDRHLTTWCLPLVAKGDVLGVLEAIGEPRPADEPTLEILGSIALQAATALEHVRTYRELADRQRALHRLVDQLMVAQEDERRLLACELHDGLTQAVADVQQLLEAYAHDFPAEGGGAQRRAKEGVGMVRPVTDAFAAVDRLTPRQREVLALTAAGLTNREIGDRLGINWRTVQKTMEHVFRQLDVPNRTQAAMIWVLSGWSSQPRQHAESA
jgi:DNA-binding CsgD family transcriptional regulator/signal transduction histidine kinase